MSTNVLSYLSQMLGNYNKEAVTATIYFDYSNDKPYKLRLWKKHKIGNREEYVSIKEHNFSTRSEAAHARIRWLTTN